jgi:peroxiredoxin
LPKFNIKMKKIILIITAAVILLSCNKDGYEVSGTAKGIENGKKVFIEVPNETGMPVAIDTAVVEDGKFKFDGKLKEGIEFAYVKFEDNASLPIILENGNIEIEFVKDSVQNSKIGGTKNNDYFQTFNDDSKSIMKKAIKFQNENQKVYMEAMQKQDLVALQDLQNKMKVFQDEMNKKSLDFVKKNNDSYLALLLIENFVNSKFISLEEGKTYFDKLSKEVQDTKAGKKMKKAFSEKPATKVATITIGQPAPDFAANTPDGKKLSLKESLGKVTIIDFWASWCGPCRKENPNVVALYNEYHSKGLNIIGVSLDKDAAKWKEAIAKDGLTWNHISNLKEWSEPIAKQYGVESIPATFILNAKGNIVAKDLRGDALKAKVKELLGEK